MKTSREWANDCWHPLELGPGWEGRLTANIDAAVAAAVAEEREACIYDVCNFCHLKARAIFAPATWDEQRERWVHQDVNYGIVVVCQAERIRARASGGNGDIPLGWVGVPGSKGEEEEK